MALLPKMKTTPRSHAKHRPEWETWQGRLVWAIEKAVAGYSFNAVSKDWGYKGSQLLTWVNRLKAGGDIHFSTVFALQKKLRVSWDWLLFGRGRPDDKGPSPLRAVPDTDDDADDET